MKENEHETTDGVRLRERSDGVYVAHHDVTEDGLCLTLTIALAEVLDADPAETISDMARYVDPDALNNLFRVRPNGDYREGGPFHLTIERCDVTVRSDGTILLAPPGADAADAADAS